MKAAKSGILLCLAICLVASGIAQDVVSPPPKIKPLVPPGGGVVLPVAPSPKPLPPANKPNIDISAFPDTNTDAALAPSPEDLLDDITALPPLPLVNNTSTTTNTTDTSSSFSVSYTFPTFLVTLLSILAAMML